MAQPIDWADLRYRGDATDVKELVEGYRVKDYLDAVQENQRQREQSLRSQLLSGGIRLTEQLSPRIFTIFRSVTQNLGLSISAEIFCLPSQEINAFAALDNCKDADHSIVGLTSAALEKLEDAEIASIIGHELGHFLFEHQRLNGLLNRDEANPAATVLPALGESLFLRWRKKAEISADRAGAIAAQDLKGSARALLKATIGLGDKNINLDIDALLAQIDEIKGRPELIRANFASHPLLPIRLKALELFCRSKKAARNTYPCTSKQQLSDDILEGAIDELMDLTRRYPHTKVGLAAMRLVAAGGVTVLAADRDISDHETRILIEVLHRYFTDEPEKEIVAERAEIEKRLGEAIELMNKHGSEQDKAFAVSRLAEVALADGALMDEEGGTVLAIAQRLKLSSKTAYSIMVGAANALGFKVDTRLNRAAEELRKSLRIGWGGT